MPVGESILLPAIDRRNPVSHFISGGMQGHSQLGLAGLCKGSHLWYETHCGDGDLVGRKLQALRVAQDADGPSDSLEVVQRLPHALQLMDEVMNPLPRFPEAKPQTLPLRQGHHDVDCGIVCLCAHEPVRHSDCRA